MASQRKSGASKATSAGSKKFIADSRKVSERLRTLKQSAVDKLIAEGKDGDLEGVRWWEPALEFGWASVRKGGQGTQWCNVTFTDLSGNQGGLAIRVSKEHHIGQIMPITDEALAKLMATKKSKSGEQKFEKRGTKPACFQIQKWNAIVKTEDDGVTIPRNAQGELALPGDDKLSPYYGAMELLGEAFTFEARVRVDRGADLTAAALTAKKANKMAPLAKCLEAFFTEHGPNVAGGTIVSSDQIAALRKQFPEGIEALKNIIIAPNTKIIDTVQTNISNESKRNPGKSLPNPMTRIKVNYDKDTNEIAMQLFDKSKPYQVDGKTKYEAATVVEDGTATPLNNLNIHEFITSGCELDGVVSAEGVCFSNMGISLPISGTVGVVLQRTRNKVSEDDIYGSEDEEDEEDGEEGDADESKEPAEVKEEPVVVKAAAVKPTTAKPTTEKTAPTAKNIDPPSKPPSEDNYDNILSELGGGED